MSQLFTVKLRDLAKAFDKAITSVDDRGFLVPNVLCDRGLSEYRNTLVLQTDDQSDVLAANNTEAFMIVLPDRRGTNLRSSA